VASAVGALGRAGSGDRRFRFTGTPFPRFARSASAALQTLVCSRNDGKGAIGRSWPESPPTASRTMFHRGRKMPQLAAVPCVHCGGATGRHARRRTGQPRRQLPRLRRCRDRSVTASGTHSTRASGCRSLRWPARPAVEAGLDRLSPRAGETADDRVACARRSSIASLVAIVSRGASRAAARRSAPVPPWRRRAWACRGPRSGCRSRARARARSRRARCPPAA
jgi:hypothetical protein